MPVLALVVSIMLAILFATPASASAVNGPIAFQSSAGINLINLDGSGATLLVRSQGESSSDEGDVGEGGETVTPTFPEMAPGGHRVAYVRVERRSTIFVKQTGLPERQLLKPGKKVFSSTAAIEELAFSPDGSRIAFVMVDRDGDRELYSIREDGRGLRKLTDNHRDEFAPTWSPNGKTIAFSRVTDRKHPQVGGRTADIFTISARDGSRQQRLTSGSTFEAYPSYSPDGKRIAFEGRPIARGPHGDPSRIWVMRSDGSHRRQITHAPRGQGPIPASLPTGAGSPTRPTGNLIWKRFVYATVQRAFSPMTASTPAGDVNTPCPAVGLRRAIPTGGISFAPIRGPCSSIRTATVAEPSLPPT